MNNIRRDLEFEFSCYVLNFEILVTSKTLKKLTQIFSLRHYNVVFDFHIIRINQ